MVPFSSTRDESVRQTIRAGRSQRKTHLPAAEGSSLSRHSSAAKVGKAERPFHPSSTVPRARMRSTARPAHRILTVSKATDNVLLERLTDVDMLLRVERLKEELAVGGVVRAEGARRAEVTGLSADLRRDKGGNAVSSGFLDSGRETRALELEREAAGWVGACAKVERTGRETCDARRLVDRLLFERSGDAARPALRHVWRLRTVRGALRGDNLAEEVELVALLARHVFEQNNATVEVVGKAGDGREASVESMNERSEMGDVDLPNPKSERR